ncbi:TPA: adenylosuccinate lyase [Patescibacteria group bacterium]|uniref:Adenylosuccinate lyase n=1 Tax=Candidatus Gottesmanbacteria bacterium GW2011_GWA1_43_11 TaxID=1618436 RepID=A0A0G1CCQ2_9BACT|nr:MAG: Adenylosuccinate lyase [Candidatus Gottesmanbacteria bacterium GW2011_GWA1_43_11]HCS79026.1 adenylosuccinate lyase [Patescibacteria group bacterium]
MPQSFGFETYLSPLSWRYGSPEMRRIFSIKHKHELWRKIWVTLAEVEEQAGIISKSELADLKKNQDKLNIERILELEKTTRHDVVAAIREFSEIAKVGGAKIHLGATSMDIVDNAEMLCIQEALALIITQVRNLLATFAKQIQAYAALVCMGYTHLQPAEPTTVGYRLSFYAQDLLIDWEFLQFVTKTIAAKGMKGAVGTRASFSVLLQGTKMTAESLDERVMKKLGLSVVLIANQVYTRKFDYLVLAALNSIASTIAKFASDVRILQSPLYGEWSEPFGSTQVGSSAMPFKKNPINSEKICSLSRFVNQLPPVALENATLSFMERTLDDSANKRLIISQAFLAVDEILITAGKILSGLVVYKERISLNLAQFAPFSATESILIAAVKKGGNRQILHEQLRHLSLQAWNAVQQGKVNPLPELLKNDTQVRTYLQVREIMALLDITHHIGDAPKRALKLARQLKKL